MDIRTVRTRAALKESLLSCLKEKSVEEIQVKEICKHWFSKQKRNRISGSF